MAAAAADLAARDDTSTAAPPTTPAPAPTIAFPTAAERETRTRARTGRLGWAMRIAAVVAIVALGGWGLLAQGQLDATRSELESARAELDAARRYNEAIAAVISAAAEPGSQAVVLAPVENSQSSGIAAVRADGSVVLAMRGLSPTSGSEVYETWVIGPDAAPVAVGDFTVDPDGTATATTRPADAPPGIDDRRDPGAAGQGTPHPRARSYRRAWPSARRADGAGLGQAGRPKRADWRVSPALPRASLGLRFGRARRRPWPQQRSTRRSVPSAGNRATPADTLICRPPDS